MKIEIELSEENEGTFAPYWVIIDPKNMKEDFRVARKRGGSPAYERIINSIAFAITGLFFSREAAENYLKAKHYNFSEYAEVWCLSGHASYQYCDAIKEAETLRDLRIKKALEFHTNNPLRYRG